MPCLNCKAHHPDFFFLHQGQIICRQCLSVATLEPVSVTLPKEHLEDANLSFELTPKQKEVSTLLKNSMSRHIMFEAVCGAGKTECVLELIIDRLNKKQKVGWAIPRRQVVLELCDRLQKVLPQCKVIAVCEGHTDELSGDLVLFTTHQAFRYPKSFDVLILDEVDAFPYRGNALLEHLVAQIHTRQCIMMSATIPLVLRQRMEAEHWTHITCYERPTRHPLMVPELVKTFKMLMPLKVFDLLPTEEKWLIFVPTHAMAKWVSLLLRCDSLTSKSKDKERVIERFILEDKAILVCTTILERGVTFKNVHVIVLMAHHHVFNEASLTQIAGRVGRNTHYPKGKVVFISSQDSEEVNACIQNIRNANTIAYGV